MVKKSLNHGLEGLRDDTEGIEGYKKTEVGVIPDDWEVQLVGQCFEISNNLRYPISEEVRKKKFGDYPYYGPTKIQGYIDEYRVEGEYALIGEDGDHFLKWRELSMTLLVKGKFNVNNHAHLVKGTKNLTQWFYYYFCHRELTPYLTRQGAGRYKLTKNALLQIPCAIPPTIEEQKAIAQSLSDVDALITECDQLITKKRNIKQGTMQQLLTGKKRLLGFSGKWEVTQLRKIVEFSNGKAHENSIVENGKFIVINSKFISTEGEIKKYSDFCYSSVSIGQIVMVMSDVPNGRAIAKCFYIDEDDRYTLNQRICSLNSLNVNSRFLFYLLDRNPYYLAFDDGVKQTNLRKEDVLSCPLTLPGTLEEQQAIAQVLSDMDTEIAALEQKRNKYKAIKQGMMQELLTGKTRLIGSY